MQQQSTDWSRTQSRRGLKQMSIKDELALLGEEWQPTGWTPPALPPLHQLTSRAGGHYAVRDALTGPTPRSNWIIPGRLLCGGAPHEHLGELAGLTCFVSLQCKGEAHAYRDGVLRLNPAATFETQPINDQSVTSDGLLVALALRILRRLHVGERVYIHCKGGHGRTGTVCSVVLGLAYSLSGPAALVLYQALHDLRQQPTFAAADYKVTDDGASCVALFPVQRQQVLRLLGGEVSADAEAADAAAADEASELAAEADAVHREASSTASQTRVEQDDSSGGMLRPSRDLSRTYGTGASKYTEGVLLESKAAGEAAAAAARARDWGTAKRLFERVVALRPDWERARGCLARTVERAAQAAALEEVAGLAAARDTGLTPRDTEPPAGISFAGPSFLVSEQPSSSESGSVQPRPCGALGKHVPFFVILVYSLSIYLSIDLSINLHQLCPPLLARRSASPARARAPSAPHSKRATRAGSSSRGTN